MDQAQGEEGKLFCIIQNQQNLLFFTLPQHDSEECREMDQFLNHEIHEIHEKEKNSIKNFPQKILILPKLKNRPIFKIKQYLSYILLETVPIG